MRPTLLLNAGYEPVTVISWQRAITLLILGKVELLEAYDLVVRSASSAMELPSVVRLRAFVRARGAHAVKFSRGNVYRRDGFTCQYCGARPAHGKLTFDHVVPRSRGGLTEWTNIVTACVGCNTRKANRTPQEAGLTLARPPARPAFMLPIGAGESVHETWRDYLPVDRAA
jgi:5-methylcytosine-specific restriction endonuclease McrA